MFDNAINEIEVPRELSYEEMLEKLFKETQKLLEKTLKEFDDFNKDTYA